MKKRFINDFYMFVICLTGSALDTLLLVAALIGVSDGSNPIVSVVSISVLLGGMSLFFLFRGLFTFEMITVEEDKIRSWKLLRKMEILYDNIDRITEEDARDLGVTGVERVWCMTDSLGNSIRVVRFKRRKKYVDAIRKRRIDQYWIRAEATDPNETGERL